ncbi:hypothetical protein BDR22DRAFT_279230 [Usnea florida]
MIVTPPPRSACTWPPVHVPRCACRLRYPKCTPSGITMGGGGGGPCDLCDEFLLADEDVDLVDVLYLFCLRAGILANIMTAVRRRAVAMMHAAMMPPWTIAGLCKRGYCLCYLCLYEMGGGVDEWSLWWGVCLFVRAWRWEMETSGYSGSEWYGIGPIGRKVMWRRGTAGRKRERHLAASLNFEF